MIRFDQQCKSPKKGNFGGWFYNLSLWCHIQFSSFFQSSNNFLTLFYFISVIVIFENPLSSLTQSRLLIFSILLQGAEKIPEQKASKTAGEWEMVFKVLKFLKIIATNVITNVSLLFWSQVNQSFTSHKLR